MKKNWRTFLIRAASALVAVALLVTLFVLFQEQGIKYAIIGVVLIGIFELNKLLLKEESLFIKALFSILALLVFISTISSLSVGSVTIALAFVIFCVMSFIHLHKTADITHISLLHAKASLGLIYMGLLPAFCYRIIDQAYGLEWFVFMLATVFAGDTFAYIFGMLFGRHKMMPRISPKKTWQGSIGGLFGSAVAATICQSLMLSHVYLPHLLIISVIASFCGQYGDFFESLLKRVADVKDSGRIMPGHGGILDRIDAVLFAGPVILMAILIMSHLYS